MSRSRKKTPIHGITTARSEKQDKRHANRALRARARSSMAHGDEVAPALREVSDVWCMDKDGKVWSGSRSHALLSTPHEWKKAIQRALKK
jgi:hypothetical protein